VFSYSGIFRVKRSYQQKALNCAVTDSRRKTVVQSVLKDLLQRLSDSALEARRIRPIAESLVLQAPPTVAVGNELP